MGDLASDIAAGARAEANLLLRRGFAWLAGVALLLFAAGLGLAAGVVSSIEPMGLAGALALWAGVAFLFAVGVLALAHRDGAPCAPRARTAPPARPDATAGSGPSGAPVSVQQAYRFGERIGQSMPPVVLAGIALAAGIIASRTFGSPPASSE